MSIWQDLERAFLDLAPAMAEARLDYQGGAAGEHWRVAGGADHFARERFEVLAISAGKQLKALPADFLSAEVSSQAQGLTAWFTALRLHTAAYRAGLVAEQLAADGSPAGVIFTGSIARPAEASAILCLRIATLSVPPAPVALVEQAPAQASVALQSAGIEAWLRSEAARRGHFWIVVATIVGIALALISLL